jgi:Glucose-6-phosphate isomerase
VSFSVEIDHVSSHERSVQRLPRQNEPEFSKRGVDLDKVREISEDKSHSHLIVIGRGGAVTVFRALYYSLIEEADVDVRLVTTIDPDYLQRLGRELEMEETLIYAVSSSESPIGVLEATDFFISKGADLVTASSDGSALSDYCSEAGGESLDTQDIPGRFSGLTGSGLVPLALAGIDPLEVRHGAEQMYTQVSPENQYNPALNLASALHSLDDQGYAEVMACIYSTRLYGFGPFLKQLMHETVCKHQKGQTFHAEHGPELHRHAAQRLLGGHPDVAPLFISTDTHERVEHSFDTNIDVGGNSVMSLNKQTLGDSLNAELEAMKSEVENLNRPSAQIELKTLSHRSVGKLTAFLQYLAYYSALIRDVSPFTQPDIESLQRRSLDNRF